MKKNNRAARAARFLLQCFDVVWQTTTWNFHIVLTTTQARSSRSFTRKFCAFLLIFRTWLECFESQFNNVFKSLYGSTQPSKSQRVHQFLAVSIMVVISKMHIPLISVTICLLVARNTESHKVSF